MTGETATGALRVLADDGPACEGGVCAVPEAPAHLAVNRRLDENTV